MPAKRKVRKATAKPPAIKHRRKAAHRRKRNMRPPATYFGMPQNGEVRATTASGTRSLGRFAWHNNLREMDQEEHRKLAALVKVLLADALGDPARVSRVAQIYKHRGMMSGFWKRGQPWSITTAEIFKIVEEIEATQKAVAPEVRAAAREPGETVHEGGRGVGGKPIVWDKSADDFTAHPKIVGKATI